MTNIKARTFTGLPQQSVSDQHLLLAAMRPRTIKCVQSAAQNLGFTVSVAEDLEHFRSHLSDDDPGLVVLDLNVPDNFGVAAIRQLQSSNTEASLILISGLDEQFLKSAERMIIDSGLRLQTVLRKPLDTISVERELSRAHQELMFSAADLAHALAEGQIRIHYQPIMDLHAGDGWKIDSFEALARWQHPQLGLISPAYFIPLAESSGMIRDLSRHIVNLALAEFAPVLERRTAMSLSLNLSTQLVQADELPDELVFLARKHNVDPARITLELSEHGLCDPAAVAQALGKLNDRGFRLCIEDFGVGESSLARFCRMPFSELKIHRSLIRDLNESDEARIVVELLIDLSRRLNLKVCAEGVENRSNVEMLRTMGCDRAQGFYFGGAVPFEQITTKVTGTASGPGPGAGAGRNEPGRRMKSR